MSSLGTCTTRRMLQFSGMNLMRRRLNSWHKPWIRKQQVSESDKYASSSSALALLSKSFHPDSWRHCHRTVDREPFKVRCIFRNSRMLLVGDSSSSLNSSSLRSVASFSFGRACKPFRARHFWKNSRMLQAVGGCSGAPPPEFVSNSPRDAATSSLSRAFLFRREPLEGWRSSEATQAGRKSCETAQNSLSERGASAGGPTAVMRGRASLWEAGAPGVPMRWPHTCTRSSAGKDVWLQTRITHSGL
mmetsp:Transcript_96634/g.268651  ORF Transcript_96634/g.268651 Transcript_96634/m.268651 type:complete len:246 (-) Transcript_96634:112-849(-)